MLAQEIPFDDVEAMNLAVTEKIAGRIPKEEMRLVIPELDLELFFRSIPGRRMLDVGCGWGRYVERFVAAGMDYVGIDYSPAMLVEARVRNPDQCFKLISYHELDVEFEEDTFDGLWCCCILNALPKAFLRETLDKMRRSLVSGGIALFVQPLSFDSIEMVSDTELGPMYCSAWSFMEFQQALHDAGFKVAYAINRFESGSMTFIGKCVD